MCTTACSSSVSLSFSGAAPICRPWGEEGSSSEYADYDRWVSPCWRMLAEASTVGTSEVVVVLDHTFRVLIVSALLQVKAHPYLVDGLAVADRLAIGLALLGHDDGDRAAATSAAKCSATSAVRRPPSAVRRPPSAARRPPSVLFVCCPLGLRGRAGLAFRTGRRSAASLPHAGRNTGPPICPVGTLCTARCCT